MTDEERYPPPYEDESDGALPPGAARRAPVHPGRRPRVPPALRGLHGLPAQPDHAVHGPVPLAARRDQHRRHGEEGQRSRHGVARPQLGADARRLVPGRRLRDALPGQVARFARRSHDPRHARGPHGVRRRRARRFPRPWRPTGGPTASIPTGSRAGSAASPTGRPRPTAAPCATASSPSRWSSSSPSWPAPAATGRGWPWPPSSTRTTSRSTGGPGRQLLGYRPDRRRHAAHHPRGALAGGLLRRAAGLPGGVRQGVAGHALRAADRRVLPAAVLLPAQAGRPGHRPHPRSPGGVRDGRRHRGRVHLRPR